MRTVLVIEDEPAIADLVRDYLEVAGFAVLVAGDGPGGLMLARTREPDVIVLDLGLPGLDGLDVIRTLRRDDRVPIVVLTARGDEVDRVAGLELGADDYVVKPFSGRELVARVRAVVRRSEMADDPDAIHRAGPLRVDVGKHRVHLHGRSVAVTPTEFGILEALAREPGRVLTRAQLLDAVHGVSAEAYERAIDGHIKNLRRKLEPEPARPTLLLTVHGVGYALADEPAA